MLSYIIMGSMVSVRIMRRTSILVVLFDWKLRIELDRGVLFLKFYGGLLGCICQGLGIFLI